MDTRKKTLIVYASAGHGHEKAARSIDEACRDSGHFTSELVDTIKLAPGFFGEFYRQSYLLQIQYMPRLWGVFYYLSDNGWLYNGLLRFLRRFLNLLTSALFVRHLIEKKPDIIIATHFMAVEVAGNLRRRKLIASKIIAVITDYLPHYVWMDDAVDAYVVAADFTKNELIKRGVSAEKIYVFGIPIEKKFMDLTPREEIARRLGVRSDVFTALLTSGGGGIGAMADVVEKILSLDKPFQLLVVCGMNKKLFLHLRSFAGHHPLLKVYEFVNNMDELMSVSDIVIGKGGGLTVTEALAKKKPMILFRSVPGQETRNTECLEALGAAVRASSVKEVADKIVYFGDHPEELKRMKEKVSLLSKPDAARKISELAEKL